MNCDNQEMRRRKRTEYVKIRKTYKVAVCMAKGKFNERKYGRGSADASGQNLPAGSEITPTCVPAV